MSGATRLWELSTEAPAAANIALVAFGPTRTTLLNGSTSDPVSTKVVAAPHGLRVFFKWDRPLQPMQKVRLCVPYRGEPPSQQVVEWVMAAPNDVDEHRWVGFAEFIVDDGDWPQVYAHRAALARQRRDHALTRGFLFELDRHSSIGLLKESRDVSHAERAFRCEAFRTLTAALEARLRQRWCRQTPTPIADRPLLSYTSALYRQCVLAADARPDWDVLGRGMCDFAAGRLRDIIRVQRGDKQVELIVCEPDSIYLFLFAELAFSALEHGIDADMWTALLPWLVRMQPLYTNRVIGCTHLHTFRFPGPPLDDATYNRIDATFLKEVRSPSQLARRMLRHMKRAAPEY